MERQGDEGERGQLRQQDREAVAPLDPVRRVEPGAHAGAHVDVRRASDDLTGQVTDAPPPLADAARVTLQKWEHAMPEPNQSTRGFEAGLWLKSAFELCNRHYLTVSEKRTEVERCLCRVRELVRAELEECVRIAP